MTKKVKHEALVSFLEFSLCCSSIAMGIIIIDMVVRRINIIDVILPTSALLLTLGIHMNGVLHRKVIERNSKLEILYGLLDRIMNNTDIVIFEKWKMDNSEEYNRSSRNQRRVQNEKFKINYWRKMKSQLSDMLIEENKEIYESCNDFFEICSEMRYKMNFDRNDLKKAEELGKDLIIFFETNLSQLC
jgi:hypothetical protein